MSDSVRPHRQQPTRLPRPWDSPGKNTGVGCHFLLQCIKVKSESEVAQSCLTLHNPMDCSPPGSSVHGIFQARVLNYHTIALISHASKVMLKISKLGFNSMWTMNFQMFKLVLEKTEEPEIKLSTSIGSTTTTNKQTNKRIPENHLLLLYWLCQSLCVGHNKLWEILQEMRIPDHLIFLLRNLYAGQEAIVRTGRGTMDCFQIGKRVHQGCILSPCLFNFYAEYIMWNARLDEAQPGIKIAGRNINNLRYADDTNLTAESEEELKSLLMKVKKESERAGLILNI